MAALVYGTNVVKQWENGDADRTTLYSVSDVNAGDTISLAPDFLVCSQVALLGITPNATLVEPSIAGNVITMPSGISGEAGYLLVYGESSGD